MEEKKNKLRGMTMPEPAMYPTINSKNEAIGRDTCRSRGVSIAPRYHEKHLGVSEL